MTIIPLNKSINSNKSEQYKVFMRMETSLRHTSIDIERNIRLAKTLAPILSDQSSNERHIKVISSDASINEKIIAILMLGFPKNRQALPFLRDLLGSSSEAIRMASAIAISQMRDGSNNEVLLDILHMSFTEEANKDVKKALRHAMLPLMDDKSASLVKSLAGI